MKRADLDTLTLLRTIRDHGLDACDVLAERYPWKIIEAAVARDAQRGLVNWGVVITRPWLEQAGAQMLADR